MDATTLVTDLAIFLVVAAVVISVVRTWRARPTRVPLAELPSEAKVRYAGGGPGSGFMAIGQPSMNVLAVSWIRPGDCVDR
jgi:hypothetical protein